MIRTLKLNSMRTFMAIVAAAFTTAGATASGPEKAVIGGEAPAFKLTDLEGKKHDLAEYTKEGKVVVLEWFNPECPFVKKHYAGEDKTMIALQEEFKNDEVVWLRINSGAEGKQGAGLEHNKKRAEEFGIETPILLDESGKVGQMYGAKRTPELFIIDTDGRIQYHGAIDDNPGPQLTGKETNYVKDALRQVLAGETVTMRETRAYGCGVKY